MQEGPKKAGKADAFAAFALPAGPVGTVPAGGGNGVYFLSMPSSSTSKMRAEKGLILPLWREP